MRRPRRLLLRQRGVVVVAAFSVALIIGLPPPPYFLTLVVMLAKLTSKNQLTLPKRALEALGPEPVPGYFEIEVQDGRIILTPARTGAADAVRRKLAEIGLSEADVADAVAWGRQRS